MEDAESTFNKSMVNCLIEHQWTKELVNESLVFLTMQVLHLVVLYLGHIPASLSILKIMMCYKLQDFNTTRSGPEKVAIKPMVYPPQLATSMLW